MATIEQIIIPRDASLVGGMSVRRVLPFRARRHVGPFVFLDEMGPVEILTGHVGDVPPHPHIGLATVTYLFEGELTHRDSLGSLQVIRPGDVNWMTAGKGIAHSERISAEQRERGMKLHGFQAWVALPLDQEESDPRFEHYGREQLPHFEQGGVKVGLIAGEAFGRRSPVRTASPLFYFTTEFQADARVEFTPPSGQEAAFYMRDGVVEIDGQRIEGPALVVFNPGSPVVIEAETPVLGAILGGEAFREERFIYWNFVSSSHERIEAAKARWRAQEFPKIAGETEFVPLPG